MHIIDEAGDVSKDTWTKDAPLEKKGPPFLALHKRVMMQGVSMPAMYCNTDQIAVPGNVLDYKSQDSKETNSAVRMEKRMQEDWNAIVYSGFELGLCEPRLRDPNDKKSQYIHILTADEIMLNRAQAAFLK